MGTQEQAFFEKHPKLNNFLGLVIILVFFVGAIYALKYFIILLKNIGSLLVYFLSSFVTSTDKIIVVAMITGTVSIVGVVISSIIAKIVDYRFNVKKYLYDKREVPYEQFINMLYEMMADLNKPEKERMTDDDISQKVFEFSRGLTLWGSNRVVKKWIKYRKNVGKMNDNDNLFLLEEIIYEMRKDVGLKRKMKKGILLSFFVNDIESLFKK